MPDRGRGGGGRETVVGDEPTLAEVFEAVLRDYETAQHHINEERSANRKLSRQMLAERVEKYRRQFYQRLHADAFTMLQPADVDAAPHAARPGPGRREEGQG